MVSGEKRNCDGENAVEKTSVLLIDIEGTTTPISFVKDTLFPYVRDNLKVYVDTHWDDEEFKSDLKALKEQALKDGEDKIENCPPITDGENEKESVIKNILWQMDLDRKTTALKQLQGHIWREGYEKGKLKGIVFPDVPPMLKKWCEDDRKLYIYSSGSVDAQKLLFRSTESGDLEKYLTGHFDTEIGPKTEASSYTEIAKKIGCECYQILFLTDIIKEAVAADKAGLQVRLVLRDGNAPLTDDELKSFSTISSFKDLVLESSTKKKKICDEQEAEKVENGGKEEVIEEINNDETEKMEVEINEEKLVAGSQNDVKNLEELKTVENIQQKTESETDLEISKSEEAKDVETKVEEEKEVESEASEKVGSSTDTTKAETCEANANGETKGEIVESASIKEINDVKKSEVTADTTNDTTSKVTDEVESQDSDSHTEEIKVSEELTQESKDVSSKETASNEENDKSINGHSNMIKEKNGEAPDEVNGSESNGKVEENVSDTITMKKVAPEEQADSTVEVTA